MIISFCNCVSQESFSKHRQQDLEDYLSKYIHQNLYFMHIVLLDYVFPLNAAISPFYHLIL